MEKNKPQLPRFGKTFVSFLKSYEENHALSGDYGEEFTERMSIYGKTKTILWFWAQVFFALGTYIKLSVRIGAAMFKNYFKITLRNIRKYKMFSFINIMGLAVGMACCILILLWVRDELSYDKFHENYSEIYSTIPELEGTKYYHNPLALAAALKENNPEILKVARFSSRFWQLKYGEQMFNEQGALVDDDFLKIFTFPLLKGDKETVLAAQESIVITERTAAKFFGSQDPIGKTLSINNRNELTVTGILKDVPDQSHLQFDFLAPMRIMGDRQRTSWSWEARTYLLLQKNVSWQDFEKKISGFVNEHDKRTDQKVTLYLQPLPRIHLYAIRGSDPVIYVYIFLTIAVAILIIACINFINLSTARSNTRAKEIGLRKVVGAERAQIIRQFFGESIFLTIFALLAAVVLVTLFLPAFNNLAQKQLSLNIAGSISTGLGLLGIALFTGILSGMYPALLMSSFKPVAVLKQGKMRSGSGGYILRKILVVSQFTATVILIIGTLVMVKQLNFIRNKDIGLDREHVVCINLNNELRQNYKSLKNEFKQNPNIINVTAARRLPTSIGHMNPVYWEGRGPDQYVTMTDASIDYDYFETLGMQILQGRSFSDEIASDQKNYVLNEEALRITGLESPLGKMFSIWDDEGQIIGVVKNFHSQSLHSGIRPVVFTLSQRHGSHSYIFVKIKPENIPKTLVFLENKANKFAPNSIFEYSFLDDEFNRQYGDDERRGNIYRAFTFLAIFISCLGLFGMVSFAAEQRTKEIGIRKTLGASIKNIFILISKDFLKLLVIANVIAWPIGYFLMNNMLNNYAYRTNITVWIFIVSGLATIGIALLSVCLKILRAALAIPADSL
ncbi:MAG: ABC transporter permease, partial [Candidatus Aminicenantes bacterium]|nr:ABC transporter permease [Candidatus Aminicenantes bacterium]